MVALSGPAELPGSPRRPGITCREGARECIAFSSQPKPRIHAPGLAAAEAEATLSNSSSKERQERRSTRRREAPAGTRCT